MAQHRCCALVVAACFLYRPLVQLQNRYQQHFSAFVIAPAARDCLHAARGSGASSLSTFRVQPQSANCHAGISQIALVATASLAASLACRRPSGTRSWSRVPCAGKKRGGGKGGGGRGGGRGGGGAEPDEEQPAVDTAAIIDDFSGKMSKSIEILRSNLATIRAGRATPALLDGVKVNAYETEVAINEVGSVAVTDTLTLTVTCYDDTVLPAMEAAIRNSGLGFSVQSIGTTLKVGIPPMTTDKRKEYAKIAKDFTEKSRVAVRNVRQTAMKKVKGLSKSISEDDSKGMQSDIEALVKKNIGECDRLFKAKEKEIMND